VRPFDRKPHDALGARLGDGIFEPQRLATQFRKGFVVEFQ